MTDLVGVITAQLMHAIEQDGGDRRTDEERRQDFEELARAAIAAVLDDLMERVPEMSERWTGPSGYTSFPLDDVLRDIISRERGRLGLASHAAPEECIGGIHGPGWPQP